jgi:DNA-binding NarL/FixJ family response regulator
MIETTSKRIRNNPNLTDKERTVAYFLACGYTDLQIAKVCQCSHRTVKAHVSNIKQKLFVDNRVLLALKLHGVKV